MRADFHKVDRLSSKVIDIVRNAKHVRATTTGGSDVHRDAQSELQVAEDERPHQPRQVGQPARRRSVHDARQRRRHARHRRRRRRLPVREVRQPDSDSPLTLRVKDNRLVEAHSENKELESDFWKYTHTDENSRSRRRVRDRHQHRAEGSDRPHPAGREVPGHPHRVRRSVRRSTPAPTGSRPRTSTSSRRASTSGSTIGRSWPTADS